MELVLTFIMEVTIGLQRCVCEKRDCWVENKSSPIRLHKRFSTLSWPQSEDLIAAIKIWDQYTIFSLI